MWVAELRGYVEFEVGIEVNLLVTELDYNPIPFLDEGFVEDGAQGGVQFFLDVLQQHWVTKLYRVLQCP